MTRPAIPSGGTRSHVPGIDGLRALAVLAVMVFHFHAASLPGGFSGVDVFFVISGYVVSASLARQGDGEFRPFLVGFYARRIVRIYPALIVCLTVAALLQSLFVPSSWLSDNTSKTGVLAFFGLSNVALIWFNDGYFSPRVEFNLFTHTWSLAVEEQFYLLFPFLMFAWLKWRDRRDALGAAARWTLPLLALVSLALAWRQTSAAPDHAYYLLPGRFWELACGALLLKLQARGAFAVRSDGAKTGLTLGGLGLIAVGFVCSDPGHFPFPWALVPVLGAVGVIAGVVSPATDRSGLSRLLASGPMTRIGRISYSLYLWHWPIAVIFRWTVGLDTIPKMLGATLLTVMAAVASYDLVERPASRARFATRWPNRRIVARGLATIVCCAVVAGGIFKSGPRISLSVTRDRTEWYPESWPAPSGRFDTSASAMRQRRMFVIGDSHTDAYSTMLQMISDQQGVRIQEFARPGCPVAGLLVPRPECEAFAADVLARVRAEARPGDIVFLASLRSRRLIDERAADEPAPAEDAQAPARIDAARREADAVIASFERAGLTVLIDAPKPVFKAPPFRCSDAFNAGNPACRAGTSMPRDWLLREREPVMASLRTLAGAHPKLAVWDPFPVLCPGSECSAYERGHPLFFDGDHLSAYGNRALYPSFLAKVASIWGETAVR